jgi:hypothetical protein
MSGWLKRHGDYEGFWMSDQPNRLTWLRTSDRYDSQ